MVGDSIVKIEDHIVKYQISHPGLSKYDSNQLKVSLESLPAGNVHGLVPCVHIFLLCIHV